MLWLLKLGITMLIHNKDDIEFVTEFPCFLGHPVVDYTRYYMSYIYSINCPRVLFLSLCFFIFYAISPPQWFYYPSMLLFNPLNGSIILLCCYFTPSMVLLSLYVLLHPLNGSIIPICCYFITSMVLLSLYGYYIPFIVLLYPLNGFLYPLYGSII